MIILSLIAIPLLLLEYFYTKERVIEDINEEVGATKTNNIPLKDQLKALITNKYYILFIIMMTAWQIADTYRGGNVPYFYIKYVLDGEHNPFMFSIYQIITGVPLGIGAIICYPLSKKFGIKNVSFTGYLIAFISGLVGLFFSNNLVVILIAGFFRQLGMIPNAYIFATLLYYAFDSIEFKSGFRLEGLMGSAIIGAIQAFLAAPFAGGFENIILKIGFIDVPGVVPSAEVLNVFNMSFYGLDIIASLVCICILPFMDVEKKIPEISAELERRHDEAVNE